MFCFPMLFMVCGAGGLEAQEGLAAISAALRSYRPAQTVMQAKVAGARKGGGLLSGRSRRPSASEPAGPNRLLTSQQTGEVSQQNPRHLKVQNISRHL